MGWGGADRLSGGGGADDLVGGRGVDTLLGGTGDDDFIYNATNEAGDVIQDFAGGAALGDSIVVMAGQFGGLPFPPLFERATLDANAFVQRDLDNLAQGAEDRFVLRLSDKTLWFDADGTGAQAAILLADLQATATLNHHDILIQG